MDIKRTAATALAVIIGSGTFALLPDDALSVSAKGSDMLNITLGASGNVSKLYVPGVSGDVKRADAPTDLTGEGRKDSAVLSWTSSGADAYRIYQYNKSTKKFEKIKTVAGTKAVIKDLDKGSYHFKVMSLTKYGSGYLSGGITPYVTVKVGEKAKTSGDTKTVTAADIPDAPKPKYTGFVDKNDNKYYFRSGMIVNGKQKIDGDYYYFNKKTYAMLTSQWLELNNKHFYITEDGTFAKNSRWIDSKLYRFDIDGTCLNYSSAKDTLSVQKEQQNKKPDMPKGKDVGFSGSGSKFTYTCTITDPAKIKKPLYEFASTDEARKMILEKLDDLRMKVVNAGYEVKLCKSDPEKGVFAVLNDYDSYSAYYDVFYEGEHLYRYHESYSLTYKSKTKTVTKVTGKVEWGKPSSIKVQVKKIKADPKKAKKQAMPSGKTAGFSGSGTKFTYTANITTKIKDKLHDFSTADDARDFVFEKFGDFRNKVLAAGYTLRIAQSDPDNDFYATEYDVGYYSAFYDVYLNGKKVYRYHEYYEYSYKGKEGDRTITKVVGTVEWKAVKDSSKDKDKKD